MKNKHCVAIALAVYLLVSFVPSLGLMALIGKGKKSKG